MLGHGLKRWWLKANTGGLHGLHGDEGLEGCREIHRFQRQQLVNDGLQKV